MEVFLSGYSELLVFHDTRIWGRRHREVLVGPSRRVREKRVWSRRRSFFDIAKQVAFSMSPGEQLTFRAMHELYFMKYSPNGEAYNHSKVELWEDIQTESVYGQEKSSRINFVR